MTAADGPEFGIEVVIHASQAHRRELFQTLEGLRQTLTREARASACEILEDSFVANRFFWVEWWPSEADREASVRSVRFTTLTAAVELLGTVETVKLLHARPAPGTARRDGLGGGASGGQRDRA